MKKLFLLISVLVFINFACGQTLVKDLKKDGLSEQDAARIANDRLYKGYSAAVNSLNALDIESNIKNAAIATLKKTF